MTTPPAEASAASSPPAPPRSARGVVLARRWPTWLALGLVALNLADWDGGLEYATVLVVAGVGYLAMAVLDRRGATWAGVVVLLGAVVVLRAVRVDPVPVLIAGGAVLIVVGAIRGTLSRPGLYRLQAPAALLFVTTALLAVSLSPAAGRYLVAAGLIGHAVWDAVHWRADTIVTRSFAEWCGVLDLGLGVAILVLA